MTNHRDVAKKLVSVQCAQLQFLCLQSALMSKCSEASRPDGPTPRDEVNIAEQGKRAMHLSRSNPALSAQCDYEEKTIDLPHIYAIELHTGNPNHTTTPPPENASCRLLSKAHAGRIVMSCLVNTSLRLCLDCFLLVSSDQSSSPSLSITSFS